MGLGPPAPGEGPWGEPHAPVGGGGGGGGDGGSGGTVVMAVAGVAVAAPVLSAFLPGATKRSHRLGSRPVPACPRVPGVTPTPPRPGTLHWDIALSPLGVGAGDAPDPFLLLHHKASQLSTAAVPLSSRADATDPPAPATPWPPAPTDPTVLGDTTQLSLGTWVGKAREMGCPRAMGGSLCTVSSSSRCPLVLGSMWREGVRPCGRWERGGCG